MTLPDRLIPRLLAKAAIVFFVVVFLLSQVSTLFAQESNKALTKNQAAGLTLEQRLDDVEIRLANINFSNPSTVSVSLLDTAGGNLLRNSSFESGSEQPRQWNYQLDATTGTTHRSEEGIRSGKYGLKFQGGHTGNFGLSQPSVKTTPGRSYTLSTYIKVVNAPKITVRVGFWDEQNNKYATMKDFSFTGTKDWSRIHMSATTTGSITDDKNWFPFIEVLGLSTGSVYLDDAQLTEGKVLTAYNSAQAGSGNGPLTLGDGSILSTTNGDLHPAESGVGSLGTESKKWSALHLEKASINKDGTLTLGSALSVGNGGTGTTSFTQNGLVYGNGTGALTALTPGTAGYVLQSNGTNAAPSWVAPSVDSTDFSEIATGTNTTATMTIGTGASLTVTGSGTINATQLNGQTTSIGGALTTGGAFTTSGANALTLTTSGATNVTLPTTGTLSTLAGTETLTNKTVNGLTLTANATGFSVAGGTTSKTLSLSNSMTLAAGADGQTFTFPATGGTVTVLGNTTTGSGNIVLATSPTLTTPTLGVASATSVNGLSLTANATGFSVAGGTTSKTLTMNNSLTLAAGADGQTFTFPATSGTVTVLGNTTTGSGSIALATSPTLTTPNIGAATATSVNGMTFTENATGFSVEGGSTTSKTLTLNNTMTLAAGADSQTFTFPATGGTVTVLGNTTTGSGDLVRATSPALTTPSLGAATATSVNGLSLTANATGFSVAGGTSSKTLTLSNTMTFAAGADGQTFTFPATGGTVTVLGNTSTGSGGIVLATSPTLTTPNIGAATATSVNGLTLTANATGFSVAGGTTSKTLTMNNSLTLAAGADGQTFTFPATSGTVTTLGNTTTGSGSLVLATSPTLTTPTIGAASATSVNGLSFTANATGFSVAGGTTSKTLSLSNSMTLAAGADGQTFTFPATSGTVTVLGNTTTGSGSIALATSPTFTTPTLGAASATTINGLTLTAAADGFTVAGGSTTSRTLTLTGADITIGSTIQPTSAGPLTVQSNGANALTLDAGGAAGINIGTTNANALTIGRTGITTTINGTTAIGSLNIGSGTAISRHISATASLNAAAPGAVPGCSTDLTVTATGAAVGDTVTVGTPVTLPANYTMNAWVSAADTVSIRWCQLSGAAADPDSTGGTYRADVWKH